MKCRSFDPSRGHASCASDFCVYPAEQGASSLRLNNLSELELGWITSFGSFLPVLALHPMWLISCTDPPGHALSRSDRTSSRTATHLVRICIYTSTHLFDPNTSAFSITMKRAPSCREGRPPMQCSCPIPKSHTLPSRNGWVFIFVCDGSYCRGSLLGITRSPSCIDFLITIRQSFQVVPA